jgi:hypothetical protein
MKQQISRGLSAFTFIEAMVVILSLGVLVSIILPAFMKAPRRYHARFPCAFNLGEIGRAYRIWEDDNHGQFPAAEWVANGGWRESLANPDQGANCWTNYAIMADDLGQSPEFLVCPADERRPAKKFLAKEMSLGPGEFAFMNNSNLSYFVGVSANVNEPGSILGGDRNLGLGTVPDAGYGCSPTNGKGNDVAVPIAGPVSWSLKMHSASNAAGLGNILLGDGSVQLVSSASFRTNWLNHAAPTTNWPIGHAPSSPSIRLVFP